MTLQCPYCDGEVEYVGVDEGDPGYLCDIWRCLDCGHEFECDCIAVDDEESDE